MLIILAILLALALGWWLAAWTLHARGRFLAPQLGECFECGGATRVEPDPPNARLIVRCKRDDCGETRDWPVRASALSMLGLTVLELAILWAAVGYLLAGALTDSLAWRIAGAAAGLIIGGGVSRLVVRIWARNLLRKPDLSPGWQEEVVAYFAPAPFTTQARLLREANAIDPEQSDD